MRWPPWRQRARCSMRPGRRPHTTVGKRPGRRRLWLPPLRTRRPFPHRCGRFGGTSMFCRTTRRCVFSTKRCCTTTLPLPSFQPTCWPGCSDSRPPAGCRKVARTTMNPPAPRQQPPRPASRPGPNKRADRANNAPARDRTLSGPAEALRRQMVARAPPPAADALLCTALALCWNPEESPYEPFTLVSQVVEAAKRSASTRAQASFLNGCLRRFLREREALVARTDGDPLARWNHPVWWVERLRKDHPQHWEQILQANNAHAPMTLRVNAQKSNLALYQKALKAINLEANPSGSVGLVLQHPVPVQSLPGFEEGW